MLGGLVLRVGNMVLDASMRAKLETTAQGGREGRLDPSEDL